jgi:hypothetical protein
MEFKLHNVIAATILGITVGVGIAYSGHALSHAIAQFRASDRAVTVKGLSEKEVKSDVAIWTIQFKNAGNDLTETYAQNEADKAKIIEFLKGQGFKESEINLGGIQVNDLYARDYDTGSDTKPTYRYILKNSITLKTDKVDAIQKAIESSSALVKSGVLIEDINYVRYFFTKLNQLRPQMLAEATRSAHELAEQFAKDSGSRVGGIKAANQGIFKIMARDGGEDMGEDTMNLYKKVRVVSTIDYYLVQ